MKKYENNLAKVYLLSYAFTKPGLFCVKSDKKGFNEYRFYDGKWIEDWPEDILFIFDGEPQEDFLLGGLHWTLVSDRVKLVFINENIQGVQFLRVKVMHNKTGKDLGPHWVLNVIQSVERLERSYVESLDIFRLRASTYISERLKRLLDEEGVSSGAGFVRMPL